jgi:hypothetical protein
MRKQIYKANLTFANDTVLPITIACTQPDAIPELIDRHRALYERTQGISARVSTVALTGFSITSALPTLHMTEEQYEEEISFCDIVEDTILYGPT